MVKTVKLSELQSSAAATSAFNYAGYSGTDTLSFPASAIYNLIWAASANNVSSMFTTIRENSGSWGADISSLSGDWQDTTEMFDVSSSIWNNDHTTFNTSSALWNNMSSIMSATSARIIDMPTVIRTETLTLEQTDSGETFRGGLFLAAFDMTLETFSPNMSSLLIRSPLTMIMGIPRTNIGPDIIWYDEISESFKMGT